MNTVYMTRVDASANMARFYSMSLQVTLFAECSLVREWGRIGWGGQVKINSFSTEKEAKAELERLRLSKNKRGYA